MEAREQKEIQTFYVMSLFGVQKKRDIRWRRYLSVRKKLLRAGRAMPVSKSGYVSRKMI